MEFLGIDTLAFRQTKDTHAYKAAPSTHHGLPNLDFQKLSMGSDAHVCQQLQRFNQRGLSAPDLHQWRLLSQIDDGPRRLTEKVAPRR
jgi:hypothetical protein